MGLDKVRVQDRVFVDAHGAVGVLSASMLYASMNGVDCRHLADQLVSLGFEAARWFTGKLTPGPTRAGQTAEDGEERFDSVAQVLQDRNMLGHAVIHTDTAWVNDQPAYDYDEHLDIITQKALAWHNMRVLEVLNEIEHPTQHPFSKDRIREMLRRIRGLGWDRPLTAGAWVKADELVNGEYWPASFTEADIADTHGERSGVEAWDNANHIYAELRVIGEKYKHTARFSGEPQRSEDVHPPGVFPYLCGVDAQGFMTWSTWHSGQARDCQVLTGQQLEDAKLFIRGGHVLPRGRYHYSNAGWSDSPVWNAAFVEWGPAKPPTTEDKTVWRAHSFQHEGGQWYLVLSGPNVREPHLEFQNGFTWDQKIDALGQHVEVWTLKQG